MDYFILTAGIIAAFASIGHLTIGKKEFLKPVMNSNIDPIPKNVMLSLFHYMTVFTLFTTIILIAFALGCTLIFEDTTDLLKIIGFTYAGFAAVQFIIAITSSIKNGIFKLFQWVFWTLIASFIFLSVY